MKRREFITLSGLAAATLFAGVARPAAASVTIVALGTSNTRGRGIPEDQAYPAQL